MRVKTLMRIIEWINLIMYELKQKEEVVLTYLHCKLYQQYERTFLILKNLNKKSFQCERQVVHPQIVMLTNSCTILRKY